MKRLMTFLSVGLLILGVMFAGCIGGGTTETTMVKLVNCKGQKTMPQLLSTGELDAVIAWQPTPAVIESKGIGKVVIYSGDLPPKGMWKNHPCCVMVVSEDALKNKNYAAKEFLKLIILATGEMEKNKTLAVEACARWLGVDREVEERSIPTIKYITDPRLIVNGTLNFVEVMREQGAISGRLNTTDRNKILDTLFDFEIYNQVVREIENNIVTNPPSETPTLKVAHLPSDHHAALSVAATYPELFKKKYGIYLEEVEPKKKYILYSHGKKVADVELILVQEGGAKIMTLMAQKQIDIGLNGVPPAVFAIDKGTRGKIVCALNSEGSAVVVRKDIPANNWEEFVNWIKEQHKEGKVVKIGYPLPVSIQYVMLKSALDAEGITYSEQ
ncbi:ABC transporter substrate-binding protein [Methanothermococcus sp. SCGC AD-155-E23]|nr:ABC transporter substrate-binding protein [Methanothermococcus sp. SCGC AD-155-E23]